MSAPSSSSSIAAEETLWLGKRYREEASQWAKPGAFCSYCLIAAVATLLAAHLAMPEAVRGLKHFVSLMARK
jgi:hypothetical protein